MSVMPAAHKKAPLLASSEAFRGRQDDVRILPAGDLTSALRALSRDQSRSALPHFNWFILPDRAMGTLSRGQYGSRPHLRGLPLATVSDA